MSCEAICSFVQRQACFLPVDPCGSPPQSPRALELASRAPWVWSWPGFLKVSVQEREAGPHWSSWCWLTFLSSSGMSNKLIAKLCKTLLGILLWACLSLLRWIFVMNEWFGHLAVKGIGKSRVWYEFVKIRLTEFDGKAHLLLTRQDKASTGWWS